MNLILIKEGNVEDLFKGIAEGLIAQDSDGYYYRLESGKLFDSQDLQKWQETNEFVFGTINGVWRIYKEDRKKSH